MYIDIEKINIYDKELLNDNQHFLTNINIKMIEEYINNILDKHSNICKYYINITENYWSVSFNIDNNQVEELCKSMFQINLYKDTNYNSIIIISNEINEYEEWSIVYKDLIKKLKK